MQKAGYKARLNLALGALALAVFAGAARADAPADLALDQVTALLHQAGLDEAWSITQSHSPKLPWLRSLSVLSNKEVLGERLCRSEETDIDLVEKNAQISVGNIRRDVVVSFWLSPCIWAGPELYNHVNGSTDVATLQRLQKDLKTISLALDGAAASEIKITYRDAESQKLFAPDLRMTEIDFIDSNYNGHSRFGFYTRGKDIIGAPEILCVEVVPGKLTELKADICGVIDIVPVKESR